VCDIEKIELMVEKLILVDFITSFPSHNLIMEIV
jgi:hypothetical protein